MRKYLFTIMSVLLLLASCTEHIDTSARYVFKQHTMASYLEAHAVYSEYLALTKKVAMSSVSSTTVYQILTARGNYTCFAPTNEAIHAYLQTLVDEGLISSPSWDSFTDSTKLDSIRKVIVKNSIIDGGDIETQRYSIAQFPTENNAEFPLPNLNDRRRLLLPRILSRQLIYQPRLPYRREESRHPGHQRRALPDAQGHCAY